MYNHASMTGLLCKCSPLKGLATISCKWWFLWTVQ